MIPDAEAQLSYTQYQTMMQTAQYEAIIRSGNHTAYSMAVLLGFILGGILIRKDSRQWALSMQQRYSILVVAFMGSFIGCALPAHFAGGVIERITMMSIVSPKTILGGILCSFIAVAAYKKLLNIDYDTSDAFARGGCLMMAIGRVGCILQHCCFGRRVPAIFGVDLGDGIPRAPVQTIEAICLFLLFFYLNNLHQKNQYPHKRLFILFAVYGFIRFNLEFLREPIADTYFNIGVYQYLALAIFLIGVFRLFKHNRVAYAETAL